MRQLKITKQVTNRGSVSLDKYLLEISKIDLLTTEEEVELAHKIKKGNYKALDKPDQSKFAFCCFCCQTVPESRTYFIRSN